MIPFAAKHAMVAIDVQTMLRWVENGGMVYHDWAEKKELLPYVRFLKTDAAEAEILTGTAFAPLGMVKGLAAIVIGHIIGCAMMLLAGLIGGRTGRNVGVNYAASKAS